MIKKLGNLAFLRQVLFLFTAFWTGCFITLMLRFEPIGNFSKLSSLSRKLSTNYLISKITPLLPVTKSFASVSLSGKSQEVLNGIIEKGIKTIADITFDFNASNTQSRLSLALHNLANGYARYQCSLQFAVNLFFFFQAFKILAFGDVRYYQPNLKN